MLRLGLLTHNFPLRPGTASDAGSFAADLASMLHGSNCEVTVFCQTPGQAIQPPSGIKVHSFQWSGNDRKLGQLNWTGPRDVLHLFSFFRNGRKEVLKFVKDYDIQYCLALWVVPSGYFAHYAWGKIGVPYTVWALGSDINKYYRFGLRGTIRRVLNHADHVLADGLALVQTIDSVAGKGRCTFLPSSRTLSNGKSGTISRSPGCRFLFVGRLETLKGIDLLIRAFERAVEKGMNATLEVIGTGGRQSEMVQYIRSHRLENRIEFRGGVSNEELVEAYRRCHCLVIPSRSESLPLVFSEAAQFGLPVIAADVGDLRHFVELYRAGQVVPPEDVGALAGAMESFVDGRMNWSFEGIERGAKELSLAGSAEKLKNLMGMTG